MEICIKPLEWVEAQRKTLGYGYSLTYWRAQTPFDWGYRIEPTGRAFKMNGDEFPAIEDAKAAAQADYETRIRSALASPPPSGTVEALLEIRTGINHALMNLPMPKNGDGKGLRAWSSLVDAGKAADAALSSAPATADGWRMVPIEPTPEMLAAFWRQKNVGTQTIGPIDGEALDQSDYAAYRAMIAAAPKGEQP